MSAASECDYCYEVFGLNESYFGVEEKDYTQIGALIRDRLIPNYEALEPEVNLPIDAVGNRAGHS